MASMIGGHFVEAYMLRKACRERLATIEEAMAAEGRNNGGSGERNKQVARGGLFGLMMVRKEKGREMFRLQTKKGSTP
ncbi:hypothetical protein BRADI_5g12192v3 [Brachypodium distachyon]|uniref:Uncharacterized protein n=1 Tax=Brachypodium distachyon TaxID=15368 RepID=A0A0Q3E521_BRADI|nr:hypothetical protein BRADI_5g12192v3 [Brachypodium distachyon]